MATKKDNCYKCQHQREVPGDAHIKCVKPDSKMVGNQHGIVNGWFNYPICFDPAWKEKECSNFEPVEETKKG